MNSTFKRRFPTFFAGLLLGLAMLFAITILKRVFAPKFLDSAAVRLEAKLAVDGHIHLRYAQEPGYFLVAGFPSQLTIGAANPTGKFQPFIDLGYRELTERETLIGPLHEAGNYELRAVFYICARPGDAICVRRNLVWPITVSADAKTQKEIPLDLDLEAILKEGLAKDPTPSPSLMPVPSQNK
ncbi:MAG: hypothetical protein ACXWQO_13660 [Bdellovibrionota bacterium]